MLHSTIPVTKWLPRYNWRDDFLGDLASGFTVAVMHIPQGMAYALLGNVPPIIGIYMAVFPVILYSMLGTSRHISVGELNKKKSNNWKFFFFKNLLFFSKETDFFNFFLQQEHLQWYA